MGNPYFREYLSTFRAENTIKNRNFRAKNNTLKLSQQLQKSVKNSRKRLFGVQNSSKMTLLNLKVGQVLTENFDIHGYLSTFSAINTK